MVAEREMATGNPLWRMVSGESGTRAGAETVVDRRTGDSSFEYTVRSGLAPPLDSGACCVLPLRCGCDGVYRFAVW